MKSVTIIEWDDASHMREACDLRDFDVVYKVRTVGELVQETETHVVMAGEKLTDGRYRDLTSIPKGMVVKRLKIPVKGWRGKIQ